MFACLQHQCHLSHLQNPFGRRWPWQVFLLHNFIQFYPSVYLLSLFEQDRPTFSQLIGYFSPFKKRAEHSHTQFRQSCHHLVPDCRAGPCRNFTYHHSFPQWFYLELDLFLFTYYSNHLFNWSQSNSIDPSFNWNWLRSHLLFLLIISLVPIRQTF